MPGVATATAESLAATTNAALEDDIASLAAQLTAATYQLLALIAEYDRREAWGPGGFRSTVHWLSWRIGLEPSAAREHVRVARALAGVPLIAQAFRRGEVSYSKVRALTRIARPETEGELLAMARAASAAQVERLVRQYRRAAVALENDRALVQQDARSLSVYYDEQGMLVIQGRLPPEQGALVMKALEAAGQELREARATASAEAPASSEGRRDLRDNIRGAARLADALVRVAERALAGGAGDGARPETQVVVHVDREVLADPAADGCSHLEHGPRLAAETSRRLACDATVVEMVHTPEGGLEAGRQRRVVSGPLRRALLARDQGCCQFPGCGNRLGLDAHHAIHWAAGGPTILRNVLCLCRSCHVRVHEGGWRVEADEVGGFHFIHPGGWEVPAAPAMKRLGPEWEPARDWPRTAAGLAPAEGGALDYDMAIGWLIRQDEKAAAAIR